MDQHRVHIDHLTIRLPRGLAGQARSLGAGLGKEIAHALATLNPTGAGRRRIEEVVAEKAVVTHGETSGLTERIARQVAQAAQTKLSGRR